MGTLRTKLGGEEGLLVALALTVGAGAGVGAIGFRYLIEGFTWLFAGHTDPLDVMKWKELFDLVEESIDHCEDVGHTLERIVLKNG